MDCFAGLDVSTRKTAICVISNDGEILLEIETPTEPAAISAALKPFRKRIVKVGHETGSLAPWLHKALQHAGFPIVCLEALHTRAMLAGQREVIDTAKELAKGEPDILEEDQRPIVFASIFDFERTLMDGSDESFLDAMDHAATESFTGWMLADVQLDRGDEKHSDREYPFEVADVFPFFAAIDQLKDEREGRSAG